MKDACTPEVAFPIWYVMFWNETFLDIALQMFLFIPATITKQKKST